MKPAGATKKVATAKTVQPFTGPFYKHNRYFKGTEKVASAYFLDAGSQYVGSISSKRCADFDGTISKFMEILDGGSITTKVAAQENISGLLSPSTAE